MSTPLQRALVCFLLAAIPASAQTGRIDITQAMMPLIITNAGPYRLAEDIEVANTATHGIEVRADDVTIDMRGFVLGGPGQGSGCGIAQSPEHKNLKVRNGFLTGWSHAILARGTGNLIENISCSSNAIGISITRYSVASNCNVFAGQTGIVAATNAAIFFCTAYDLEGTGFALGPASRAVLCTSYDMRTGFAAESNSLLDTSTAYDCSEAGISAQSHVTMEACVSYSNGVGIVASSQCVVRASTAVDNRDDGVRVQSDSEVTGCSASGNMSAGIHVEGSASLVENNKTVGNRWGILVDGDRNTVVGNKSGGNSEGDFAIHGSNTVGSILPESESPSNAVEDANFQL